MIGAWLLTLLTWWWIEVYWGVDIQHTLWYIGQLIRRENSI